VARRKLREAKSKFSGTKNILQQINQPSHRAIHERDPITPAVPPGGFTGQALVKLSDDDFDVGWAFIDTSGITSYDGGDSTAVHTPPALDGNSSNAAHSDTVDGGSS
jgi:hypothetical protein